MSWHRGLRSHSQWIVYSFLAPSRCWLKAVSQNRSYSMLSGQFNLRNIDDPQKRSLISQLGRCRGTKDIKPLEDHLSEYRHKNPNQHDPVLYALAIDIYLIAGQCQKAIEFLQSSIAAGFKPSLLLFEALINAVLRKGDLETAQQLMKGIESCQLEPSTSTWNLWIKFYLHEHQFRKAQQTMKQLLNSTNCQPDELSFLYFVQHFVLQGDWTSAERVRALMKSKGIVASIRFFNGLLRILLQRRMFDKADLLLEEMATADIDRDYMTYDLLVGAYASILQYQKVDALLDEMQTKGFRILTRTFNSILQSYSTSSESQASERMLHRMNELGLRFTNHTFAALITSLIHQQQYDSAHAMIEQLKEQKVVLSCNLLEDLLRQCADCNFHIGVQSLTDHMNRHALIPTRIICSTLLVYLLRHRQYNKVDSLLMNMLRHWNLKPNAHILTTLLSHFVEAMDFPRIHHVVGLFKSLEIEPTEVMYQVMMKVFYPTRSSQHGGHLFRTVGLLSTDQSMQNVNHTDQPVSVEDLSASISNHKSSVDLENAAASDQSKETVRLQNEKFDTSVAWQRLNVGLLKQQFEKLYNLPFRPTTHIYNELLLSAFMVENHTEFFRIYDAMRAERIKPNLLTFSILIKAYAFAGDINGAAAFLDKMVAMGLKPTSLHCGIIMHAYSRQLDTAGAEAFLQMAQEKYALRLNHIFFASLLYSYCCRKEYSTVFKTFERMEASGLRPDTETCNYVLISLFAVGEAGEAMRFFERMKSQNIPRNRHTYLYYTTGLVRNGHDPIALAEVLKTDSLISGNKIYSAPFLYLLAYVSDPTSADMLIHSRFLEEPISKAQQEQQQQRTNQDDQWKADSDRFVADPQSIITQHAMESIVKILVIMIEACVPFTPSMVSYMNHAFNALIEKRDSWNTLERIYCKALVDLGSSADSFFPVLMDNLLHIAKNYRLSGMCQDADRVVNFLEPRNLAFYRQQWTDLSPEIQTVLAEFRTPLLASIPDLDFNHDNDASSILSRFILSNQESDYILQSVVSRDATPSLVPSMSE